ncbi:Cytochrome P450, conserved site,Cytochrome P450,Cytochrome P450, E-class, group I [Cinara cedri]|uniref:Cytochrome P450, conserved site,Cytochrome P450,Cytochrome P450, E-class, group I n=1 Tax=Cinara cedri TaxID=506608 RepID=A0A5E4NJ65_9HEMI|nr:Cytochrome P450, conserved site,Cytochrome P450,Cytochrome P450, E-class, group I [Cinara cedri]
MQMFQGVRLAYFNCLTFGFPVTGTQLIVFAVLSVFVILLCFDKWNRRRFETLANKLKGPPDYPIIGSCLESFRDKRLTGLVETLTESNEAEERVTDDDIMSHVITIAAAGFETTSLTASYCLLLLAMYPDIQDKVYDEIYSVLGDGDEPITIDHTSKMVYLKQVIHESLRLFPTAPLVLRQLQDDVTIFSGNHTLPKGTVCIITPVITHYNPELYPNPKSFNPDNFNAENVAKRHKYGFIAFSGGPRSCIGMKYGLVFVTVLLTELLRKFSVHTDMKLSDIKLKLGVTLHNTVGFPITIQSRKKSSL